VRPALYLLTGLLLTACSLAPAPAPTALPLRPTSPPTSTNTPLPPTISPIPSATPSLTPTETWTGTPTLTPSETPVPWTYVFPIQPSSLAGFAPGGHPYPATDLFAPAGTKFVAVTSGVVDFVSTVDRWDPAVGDLAVAGGLCVAIVGDDGVRYYGSHLRAVADGIRAGVRVEAGQLLGYVGNSGNARTTDPHVHFGISRPTYPEDWETRRGQVDPYPFLAAWRACHNVTPPLPTP
jgi:murein DD-endopeptidase MepM/ murein hydrolase activator NlpD